eukprot:991114_1
MDAPSHQQSPDDIWQDMNKAKCARASRHKPHKEDWSSFVKPIKRPLKSKLAKEDSVKKWLEEPEGWERNLTRDGSSVSNVVKYPTTALETPTDTKILDLSREFDPKSLVSTLKRDMNVLNDCQDVQKRVAALFRIKSAFVGDECVAKNPKYSSSFSPLFDEMLKPLVKRLEDKSEKCRLTALEIVYEFVSTQVSPLYSVPYIVPAVVYRLTPQKADKTRSSGEPSEEVRLEILKLLQLLVKKCHNALECYLVDLLEIMKRMLKDDFPDVLQASCACLSALVTSLPRAVHAQTESLCQAALPLLGHRLTRVRIDALKLIRVLLFHGAQQQIR